MARVYSTDFQKTINSVSAQESPLILLEINHPNLVTPVRVVGDTDDLIHNGVTFTRCAFRISLPDDPEGSLPQATLEIDNIGRELVQWLEIADWNLPTTATLIQVMRSRPNVAEFTITMDMTDISVTPYVVSAKLGFDNLLGLPAMNVAYTSTVAPGLF